MNSQHHMPIKPSIEELDYLMKYLVDTSKGLVIFGGREIGHINSHGYVIISGKRTGIGRNRKKHLRSHVVWWAHFGEWPRMSLDHIDGNRIHDAVQNLREVTVRENNSNSPRLRSLSLPTGVSISASGKRYEARIGFEGRMQYLGTYSTPEEAGSAYQQARANQRPKT